MEGVAEDVRERLGETEVVAADGDGEFRGGDGEVDAGAEGGGAEGFCGLGEEDIGADVGSGGRGGAGEEHPLLDEVFDFGGFAGDAVEGGLVFGAGVFCEELGVEVDGGDWVADLVGHGGGHAAEDDEAFGLFALGAFGAEGGSGGGESAGEFADFVRAGGFGESS